MQAPGTSASEVPSMVTAGSWQVSFKKNQRIRERRDVDRPEGVD